MNDGPYDTDLLTTLGVLIAQRDEAADAFDLFKQDAIMAHAPEASDAPSPSSDDAADVAVSEVERYTDRIRTLVDAASDEALAAAYAQTNGEVGNLEAEILHAAMERRGLAV